MKTNAIIGTCVFMFSQAFSATLQVPGDHNTIQKAIEAASHGDSVVVAPGTYAENIDFLGKRIILTSRDPNDPDIVNTTIVKPGLKTIQKPGRRGRVISVAAPSGPVVQFINGETSDAMLTGFTITEGVGKMHLTPDYELLYGAGIYCNGADPRIVKNIISKNGIPGDQAGCQGGGGIFCQNSEAKIADNLIMDNYAFEGGGIFAFGGRVTITRNHITENRAAFGGGCALTGPYLACNLIDRNRAHYEGGGIALRSIGTVIHNTVVANAAGMGGNLLMQNNIHAIGGCQVVNNIFAGALDGGGILWRAETRDLVVRYNAIWQNTKDQAFQKLVWSDQDGTWLTPVDDIWDNHGNLYVDPGFVDEIVDDYHLRPDSPCINAGDPDYAPVAGQTDMDGTERVYASRTDMGAYEYVGYIWPVAHAGQVQHIPEPNTWITLDGSESRIHDPVLPPIYHWQQLSGPTVELVDGHTPRAQFLPISNGIYEFELVVSDDQSDSRPDTVTITVGPVLTHAACRVWSQTDNGNGHAYQPVRFSENVTWADANYLSVMAGGYLATMTSAEENLFAFNLVNNMDRYWTPISCVHRSGPWLGGYQLPGSREPDGGWVWVTGEPFEYNAWLPGSPSGTYRGDNENLVSFHGTNGNPSPGWNDSYSGPNPHEIKLAYITEYDPVEWQTDGAASIQGGYMDAAFGRYTGAGYIVLDSSTSPTGKPSIQWHIPVGPKGPRQFSLRYAQHTGDSIEVMLGINGTFPPELLVLPDTGAWDEWATVSIPVCFQPSINTVTLSLYQTGSILHLDKLGLVDENTNLVLNRPINFGYGTGQATAAFAVDGDHLTAWESHGFPQWIEIDLEDNYSIRRTQLIWHDDSVYHYLIETKTSWDSAYARCVDAAENMETGTFWVPRIHDIDLVEARYIRLTVLGKAEDTGSNDDKMGLVEFRVNAVIDAPALCSKLPELEPEKPEPPSRRR